MKKYLHTILFTCFVAAALSCSPNANAIVFRANGSSGSTVQTPSAIVIGGDGCSGATCSVPNIDDTNFSASTTSGPPPSGTYVDTLSTILSSGTPPYSGGYTLAASGGGCTQTTGANSRFQVSGDQIQVGSTAPTAGTAYTLCVQASGNGTTITQSVVVTPYNIQNAATSTTGGDTCSGSGTSASPWNYGCIQNAVNNASSGDTIYLPAGNFALSTADATYITINKTVNLMGVASGNTFDIFGHVNNAGPTDLCPVGTSPTITCIYQTGTSYAHAYCGTGGSAPACAGFILFGTNTYGGGTSCAGTISGIFFDGSQATDGGDLNGELTIRYCNGPTILNNIRHLTYNSAQPVTGTGGAASGCNGETQIAPFETSNLTILNGMYSSPFVSSGTANICWNGGAEYTGAQILQPTGGNGIGSNINVTNNVLYQGSVNFIYYSYATYNDNVQFAYTDGNAGPPFNPGFGYAGAGLGSTAAAYCPEAGTGSGSTNANGQCNGDAHFIDNNNLFYSPGYTIAIGSTINDPSTSGGINDLNYIGNWIIASDGEIDSCTWYPFNDVGNCTSSAVGMTIDAEFDTSCNETDNDSWGFNVTNNSIIATTKVVLNEEGNANAAINCKLGNPFTGSYAQVPINIYGFNGQYNYLSSAGAAGSNEYLTNANTISPVQQNNYCAGTGGGSGISGCATSGFTTQPTCSFTLGNPYEVNGTYYVPINSPAFTAQYGAVQWYTSTSSSQPSSASTLWSSNNSSFPNSAGDTYIPPYYLNLGSVGHGKTVYMWVMDSANHIAAATPQSVP